MSKTVTPEPLATHAKHRSDHCRSQIAVSSSVRCPRKRTFIIIMETGPSVAAHGSGFSHCVGRHGVSARRSWLLGATLE